MENRDRLDEIPAHPDDEGDCPESKSADFDEPNQPQSKSREFSDFDAQCAKIERLMAAEMSKYDSIQKYWHTLTLLERYELMTDAAEAVKNGYATNTRSSYFWLWFLERRQDNTLNYSEFAREIGVPRHVVTRQIRPRAIKDLVGALDKLLLIHLYLNETR
jgi:hypothetical protein